MQNGACRVLRFVILLSCYVLKVLLKKPSSPGQDLEEEQEEEDTKPEEEETAPEPGSTLDYHRSLTPTFPQVQVHFVHTGSTSKSILC